MACQCRSPMSTRDFSGLRTRGHRQAAPSKGLLIFANTRCSEGLFLSLIRFVRPAGTPETRPHHSLHSHSGTRDLSILLGNSFVIFPNTSASGREGWRLNCSLSPRRHGETLDGREDRGHWMRKTFGMLLLMLGAAGCCMALPQSTPEIDPASGGCALALVAGALLVIRGRRK